MKEESPTYNVTALRKSIAVMDVLRKTRIALGVSEIARQADISKNMCFRILETLVDLGWVEQTSSVPGYELSLKPFQFFSGTFQRKNILDHSLSALRRLHLQVGESVYLSVLHDFKALNIYVLQGTKTIAVSGEMGGMYDLHATAPGKILMAGMDSEDLDIFFAQKLVQHTPKTLTRPAELREEIKKIHQQGFAVNLQEFGIGLLGLAAPVRDGAGKIVAAMGFFAPSTNMNGEQMLKEHASIVMDCAHEASKNMNDIG